MLPAGMLIGFSSCSEPKYSKTGRARCVRDLHSMYTALIESRHWTSKLIYPFSFWSTCTLNAPRLVQFDFRTFKLPIWHSVYYYMLARITCLFDCTPFTLSKILQNALILRRPTTYRNLLPLNILKSLFSSALVECIDE